MDDPTGAHRNADIVLGAAVIAMGLVAGLFYFSSIAVMPALTAADDRTPASTAAFGSVAWALVLRGRTGKGL